MAVLTHPSCHPPFAGCPAVREEFVNGNQTSSTGYQLNRYLAYDESYVPQCAADGLFERVQCTMVNSSGPTEFGWTPRPQCWCVDPVTGIPVTEFPSYGAGNDTACTTAYVDTAALCEVCSKTCDMDCMYVHDVLDTLRLE